MCHSARIMIFSLLAMPPSAGCGTAPVEERSAVTIVVSGDTGGWIVPCGCTANQSGGLLRRGSYLQRLRKTGLVLYADVGGAVTGTSEYDRLKFEAILRGEAAMGIVAHNIGTAEARLGAEFLRQIAPKHRVPLLTCNVRDASDDLLGERFRIVKAGGRKIVFVGVLSDSEAISDVRIDSPRKAILSALSESAVDYDSLVVLAYLPEDELNELAANLPEADLIVGGPTGQSIPPHRQGPTSIASATNKGKFLAVFATPASFPVHWEGEVVEITARFEDEPQQKANLDEFYETLGQRDLSPLQTSFADRLSTDAPESFRIAGTANCRNCHTAHCEAWDGSRHAHAWESLTKTGAQVDAYCQQCHVTGFGLPGGFESARRSAMHAAVGCESCHGPSYGHVQNQQVHTTYFGRAHDQCTSCHDRENSPTFVYAAYWEQIQHGAGDANEQRNEE